jgi:hypothetical protein
MPKTKTKTKTNIPPKSPTLTPRVVKKSLSLIRRDIATWRAAVQTSLRAENPRNRDLQDLYDDIMLDNLLTSQVNNRFEQTISCNFELVNDAGKADDSAGRTLRELNILPEIIPHILQAELYGYSLIELSADAGSATRVSLIPRRNVVPLTGRFYPDAGADEYIPYRETREYNLWILEFNTGNPGLLNKLSSPCLFKKFATSCWSELCEIYGIPPRYIKTNTTDAAMLDRAETMMREIGAAAWFIIDTTEEFQFANAANTNGDVYSNLINLCSNEISMLLSGAIIGQDTQNGNYSKEKSSQDILQRLVDSDKRTVENTINSLVLPALIRIGWMPVTDLKFRFKAVENTDKLWTITKDLLPYKNVDSDWISKTFGIPVKDIPQPNFP